MLPIALVLALAVMNGGCILIPELKDRVVELAVGGTTSAVFTVQGATTAVDETQIVDVGTELNLAQILSDAGIDVSNVTNIALTSVAYRIVRADTDPALEITNGNITVQRGGGTVDALVNGLTAAPGAVSGFQNVALDAAGVATINTMLSDILTALPGAPANPTATFHLTGTSTGPTNFDFEMKITISITGTVSVRVPT
ncbi:MAG TPA: hypothetical protein VJY35_01065 [Candidatus Eisenbacteria bacterium]|nr:hypothetical protein [Candidatus Eisenbacteria bacterium]